MSNTLPDAPQSPAKGPGRPAAEEPLIQIYVSLPPAPLACLREIQEQLCCSEGIAARILIVEALRARGVLPAPASREGA